MFAWDTHPRGPLDVVALAPNPDDERMPDAAEDAMGALPAPLDVACTELLDAAVLLLDVVRETPDDVNPLLLGALELDPVVEGAVEDEADGGQPEHGERPVPVLTQTCTPSPPPGQAQLTCAPGTHTAPPPLDEDVSER